MARQGNKRAPGRRKQGQAHGFKPRILEIKLNAKIRIQALKVMLSAKLFENKVKIIDSEQLVTRKTKDLHNILKKNQISEDLSLFVV